MASDPDAQRRQLENLRSLLVDIDRRLAHAEQEAADALPGAPNVGLPLGCARVDTRRTRDRIDGLLGARTDTAEVKP